jgi:hypothetical protein
LAKSSQLHTSAFPSSLDEPSPSDNLKSLVQECGVAPHKLPELVQELPPKALCEVLVDYYFTSINYTRYPIDEVGFRASFDSICNNGHRVQPDDVRFLPLLFVVLAISARLAPETILGDERSRRLNSLRYYWSCMSTVPTPSIALDLPFSKLADLFLSPLLFKVTLSSSYWRVYL